MGEKTKIHFVGRQGITSQEIASASRVLGGRLNIVNSPYELIQALSKQKNNQDNEVDYDGKQVKQGDI